MYIFYPIFESHFLFFNEVFSEDYVSENSFLMYGLYSRAVSDQERLIVVHVWYIKSRINIQQWFLWSEKYARIKLSLDWHCEVAFSACSDLLFSFWPLWPSWTKKIEADENKNYRISSLTLSARFICPLDMVKWLQKSSKYEFQSDLFSCYEY